MTQYRENYNLLKKSIHVLRQRDHVLRKIYTDFKVYMYTMTPSQRSF